MKKTKQVLPRVEQGPRPSLSFTAQRHGKPPKHMADLTRAERRALVADLGYPQFRADQISKHYFEHDCADPEKMTDLPAAQRKEITQVLLPQLMTKVKDQVADKGATIKTLWKLFDGAVVESVLMKYPQRATLCISSQAGCGMACPFCATGQAGLTRNLSTAEIIEQLRYARELAASGIFGEPVRVTNVVFMGMGEPLANFPAVRGALRRMIEPAPEGFGMSARNITVSTVGMVPVINKLADEGLPVTLAVSLHAPDDALRDDLIPINSRYKVGELLDAARHYFVRTGRRVSIEYALIKDMNDHEWRAELLAAELNSRGHGWAHVNPIPLNPTPGSIWTCSTPETTRTFVRTLSDAGISTTIRDTRGSDIDGACGQLAAEVVDREHVSRRAAKAQAAVDARIESHRSEPIDFDSTLAAIAASGEGEN
ncbi:dual-specificity RNA methyltransferase RlmN [Arcanobacterium haemolyticum]|uniref:Probable dual-specificity RNA methyltransferase RlmN n=1 Tax=Arcanobacterium haemolyticum (strain ATCC 9345 / DSM 20595 / CCM 5947 / CCUG 17215 / LMG 16163 / NBRC 15585 / NCTC 8452 / 11018) TaxID=644284 RepID=D7BN40_ARCHD|nr:23S rRNA (adenine(2503)-C(2))-methyltransferase RlmN [Arcanobacterium haemolyticum]ADH92339.1 radical SAM enzyme, Cfr family [Arcanobacterium haemolyticum DSM 20595]QCX46476.1 dual-specificity RNA methyltransferase RlmN [Arcanobacterium haemolyticum]SPT75942.1 Ribosomal RNA large subunit methyltransferase N [Arcanobacterium haemolyticum]SQH28936.1 Ribosomal RNA large subunit methyltransferase N [Arcanobacterium haemolyticum]